MTDNESLIYLCNLPLSVDVVLTRVRELSKDEIGNIIFQLQTELMEREEMEEQNV